MMLYIHIPFCVKKCDYCDFLSFSGSESRIEPYVSALCKEIELRHPSPVEPLTSIYIGGGTPSLLTPIQLEKIFSYVNKYFYITEDCEITLEMNPGAASTNLISALNSLPINRVSIGLQSADNEELKLLGRIHSFSDFLRTYETLAKSNIENVSVDIMTGIPHQTLSSLEKTLRLVIGLRPTHISTYALMLEEDTPFFYKYKKFTSPLPNEEEEYRLYRLPIDYLKERGYKRYEISNFSKDGYSSRHNLGYWERTPYIGVGLGAASLLDGVRYKNTVNMAKYLSILDSEAPNISEEFYIEVNNLTRNNEIEEFMYLGLRKTDGIYMSQFELTFGEPIDAYYHNEFDYLIENGFLERNYGNIRLTDLGLDLSNQVLSRFLLD